MWTAIQYVTSGLSLAAFISVLVSIVIRAALRSKAELIEKAPPDKRAHLIEQTMETYHIPVGKLTEEHKYRIIMEQLSLRSKRQGRLIAATSIAFLIVALFAGYFILTAANVVDEITITGVVQDVDGHPISGAKITAESFDLSVESRTTGEFSGHLANLTKGQTILFHIMHIGYVSEPVYVTINASTIELHTIQLKKATP